jgi:hypothetical protein
MERQYVQIKLRPTDARRYTYHNDGDPVKVGDEVKVPDNRSDDWKRVIVTGVYHDKPHGFETKAILGLAPPREDATA